jgi:6-phosphogluconolactonase (cycloisomerase 2 family)
MARAFFRLLVFMLLVSSLLGPGTRPAKATAAQTIGLEPIVVNTVTLANDAEDGKCDLWEALKASFDSNSGGSGVYNECTANPGPTLITFSPAIAGQTITLPAAQPYPELPSINGEVIISGPIIIDGGGQAADLHIFRLTSTGRLTLINLTLTNAFTSGSGGAILDNAGGQTNLIGVSMIGNTAESNGGAIDSIGDVNIIGSTFTGNRALGTRDSGLNDQSGTGFGGALSIGAYASLTIAGSTFNGNFADKGGGAIYFNGKQADIIDTAFNGNIMNDLIPTANPDTDLRGGGAIQTDPNAVVSLTRTIFDANVSISGHGGALYTAIDGVIQVIDSAFTANLAGDTLHMQMGGAWYNGGALLDVRRSVFLFNIATDSGGGLANDRTGEATLSNLTFFRNDAVEAGGAIWNGQTQAGGWDTYLTGYNLTIADSDTPNGAIYNQEDGGHTLSLANGIVRHDADPNANCFGPVTSLGNNIDDGSSCGFGAAGDLSNTDPKLQSLAFNGGALPNLLSMKLSKTSPGVDSGNESVCQNTFVDSQDQSGAQRPQGGGCDRGALENAGLKPGFGALPVQPGPVDFGSLQIGDTSTLSFEILETGNDTLQISSAVLGGANANQFSINTPTPITLLDGDLSVFFSVSCSPTGSAGSRSATLTLNTNDPEHASVVFNLSCNATAVPVASFASSPIVPGPVDFGQVALGDSELRTVVLSNNGSATLTLSNPQESGSNPDDFQISSPLPISVNANLQSAIQIECLPLEPGIRTTTVTFTTNDPSWPTVSFDLACEGVAPPSPVLESTGESLSGSIFYPMNAPYGVAISPDGQHVYVTAREESVLTVFKRDAASGELTLIQAIPDATDLVGSYLVIVSPDGGTVYVSSGTSNTITVFERDLESGLLTKMDSVADGDNYGCFPLPCDGSLNGLAGAYGMAISPDGKYFYASGINDDSIVVLSRGSDGSLSWLGGVNFVQTYTDATNLNGAYGLAVSPDGAHIYATSYIADRLVIFNRNAENGQISFSNAISSATVLGLNGVFRVIVSKDGQFVYTASYDSDSITVFQRDASDGSLTHIATYTNGINEVTGLDAVTSVALSPDQRYLVATGYNSDAVVVFERDTQTGLLNFIQRVTRGDGGAGLPALDGARDVVVSPEGSQVFVTGYLDDRLVALRKANPIPSLSSLSPTSVSQGAAALILQVQGEDFVTNSVVRWNGSDLATEYISASLLQAEIPASGLAAAGVFGVEVYNPAPGGGNSVNALEFTVLAAGDNPVPEVTSVLPGGASAGDPAFTLVVRGEGFVSGAVVRWNGFARTTTFISSTELQVNIAQELVAQPGMASVSVSNPTPGGGESRAVLFEIAGPGENPVPGLAQITPSWAFGYGVSGPAQMLTVNGTDFLPGSVVYWNGKPRPTTYVSSSVLQIMLGGADLAFPTTALVSVVNPTPGGGASSSLEFRVIPWFGLYLPGVVSD